MLNRYQKLAAESSDRYICIIAGPGTGKTMTITSKIIHLLENGIDPKEIAALTFTQKSAIEMRERVIKRLNTKNDIPFIGTFHLLCIRLLREFLPERERNFKICNRTAQKEIIVTIGKKSPERLIEKISKFKNKLIELDEKDLDTYWQYENRKKELNLLDFDDLLIRTHNLLKDGVIPKIFSYIIVDEFQDINRLQYKLIKRLLKENGFLSVFGDPDQAIYSFRGSEIELFLDLPRDFRDLNLLNLSINYRSQANIIYASNKFITANTKRFSKKIEPIKKGDSKIKLIYVEDDREEAKTIVNEIRVRLGASDFSDLYKNKDEDKYTFANLAILARTNSQIRIIKEALMEAGFPIKTPKKDSETWISDMLKKLSKIISNQNNTKKLFINEPLFEFIKSSGLMNDLSETEKFLIKNIAKYYSSGTLIEQIRAFIDELSGLTPLDLFPENLNAISLLTIHSAKGLEFPVVFIAGFDEGLIPYTLSNDTDLEEERRLFYVGMTRAMDELILIHAKRRFLRGKSYNLDVSSFLREIPNEYIDLKEVCPIKGRPRQKELF